MDFCANTAVTDIPLQQPKAVLEDDPAESPQLAALTSAAVTSKPMAKINTAETESGAEKTLKELYEADEASSFDSITEQTRVSLARFENLRKELASSQFKQELLSEAQPIDTPKALSQPCSAETSSENEKTTGPALLEETLVQRRHSVNFDKKATVASASEQPKEEDHLDSLDAFIDECESEVKTTAPSQSGNQSS